MNENSLVFNKERSNKNIAIVSKPIRNILEIFCAICDVYIRIPKKVKSGHELREKCVLKIKSRSEVNFEQQ